MAGGHGSDPAPAHLFSLNWSASRRHGTQTLSFQSGNGGWRRERPLPAPARRPLPRPSCLCWAAGPGAVAVLGKSAPFWQTQPGVAPSAGTGVTAPLCVSWRPRMGKFQGCAVTAGKILVCFPRPHSHPLWASPETKCSGAEVVMCLLLGGPGSVLTGALIVFS